MIAAPGNLDLGGELAGLGTLGIHSHGDELAPNIARVRFGMGCACTEAPYTYRGVWRDLAEITLAYAWAKFM